jgi:hypothetical protein
MTRQLSVGDTVICRFFNTPDGTFYGDEWEAIILEINHNHTVVSIFGDIPAPYKMGRKNLGDIWLKREEILRRVESKGRIREKP